MAILANQKVLTLDYWKPANKLQVGDYLFNKDGGIVQVKIVQEYRVEECYNITFNDHLKISGDKNLGFLIENRKYRNQIHVYKAIRKFRRPLKFINVENLQELSLKDSRNRLAFSLPTAAPLAFPHQFLDIPPFVFGYWFFNANAKGELTFSNENKNLVIEKFKNAGYKVIEGLRISSSRQKFKTIPSINQQLTFNIPTQIPKNYIFSGIDQRLELLSGIIQAKSRQYNKTKDRFRISSFDRRIFLQIQELVETLGNKTMPMYDPLRKTYTVFFKTKHRLIEGQVSPPVKVHYARRFIKQIEPIGAQLCVHIETDGKDNSFLVGEGFISCL